MGGLGQNEVEPRGSEKEEQDGVCHLCNLCNKNILSADFMLISVRPVLRTGTVFLVLMLSRIPLSGNTAVEC